MSSIIIHLCMADIIKKKLQLKNEFLAGAIMPDLLTKCGRNRQSTHSIKEYLDHDNLKFLPDIVDFEAQNKTKLDSSYIQGYLAHLVQDRVWFDEFIPKYAKTNRQNKDELYFEKEQQTFSLSEFKKRMYEDYLLVDAYVVAKYNVDLEDIKSRIKTCAMPVNDVIKKIDELVVIPENININSDTCAKINSKLNFLSIQDIDDYIEIALDRLLQELEDIN